MHAKGTRKYAPTIVLDECKVGNQATVPRSQDWDSIVTEQKEAWGQRGLVKFLDHFFPVLLTLSIVPVQPPSLESPAESLTHLIPKLHVLSTAHVACTLCHLRCHRKIVNQKFYFFRARLSGVGIAHAVHQPITTKIFLEFSGYMNLFCFTFSLKMIFTNFNFYSFQIKDGTWRKTILEVDTSKTHRLPIHDVAVYDIGDTGEEFGLEIGPVCFS